MNENPYNAVIVRILGEIPIKSEAVRSIWERKIYHRIIHRVKDLGGVERRRGYFFIKTNYPFRVIDALKSLFGISSLIPAIMCSGELDEIKQSAAMLANYQRDLLLERGIKPESFAIISKKVISKEFGTTEIRYDVGQFVKDSLGLEVNLDNPDIPIYIEVRHKEAFIYSQIIRVAGGLPVGVQDRIIMLTTLDLESIVSIWLLMKRGCPITVLYFITYEDKELVDKFKDILMKIFEKSCEGLCRVFMIPIHDKIRQLRSNVPKDYLWLIALKFMVTLAEKALNTEKARGIAIGIRGTIDAEMEKLLRLLKSDKTTLHYPVLTYTDSEIKNILNKIEKLLDIDIPELKKDYSIIYRVRRTARKINPERFMKYWDALSRQN